MYSPLFYFLPPVSSRDRSWQYISSFSLLSSLHWHQFIVIYSDEYVIFSRNNKLYLNLNLSPRRTYWRKSILTVFLFAILFTMGNFHQAWWTNPEATWDYQGCRVVSGWWGKINFSVQRWWPFFNLVIRCPPTLTTGEYQGLPRRLISV
jgi:hypothetical protein